MLNTFARAQTIASVNVLACATVCPKNCIQPPLNKSGEKLNLNLAALCFQSTSKRPDHAIM